MRYQSVSEVVGSLWWYFVGTSLAGPIALIDSHVSVTFQSFLPGLVVALWFCLVHF